MGELVTPPVSFDLWDTVLWHPGGPNPASRDRVALVAQLTGAEPAEVSRALRGRPLPYDQDSPRDLTLTTQLSDALAALDASPRAVAKAVERFMELSFRYPPIPAPGLRRVLPRLAQGQLAIVSNTRWTPGAVLERFLAEEGLAEFFATLAFSDQTGWAKPAAGAFAAAWDRVGVDARRTVHIGDRVDRDVEGAKRAGAKGVVCRVIRRAREDGDRRADGILCEYAGLEAMLARVCDRDMPGWELVAEGVPVLGPPVLGRVSVPEPVPPGEAGPVARDGRIALLADGEASPGGPVDWAAAIVAETGDADGAVARHAAAVGIPCVVGAKGLRRRAGEGDLLLVDGATGQVHAPVDGRD